MKVGLKIVSQSLRPDGWPPTRTETHAGQLRPRRCKRRVQPTRSTGPGRTTAADDGGGTTGPANRPLVEGTKSFSAPFDARYRRLRYPSLLGSRHVSLGMVREATARHGRGAHRPRRGRLDPARCNGGQQLLAPLHRDRTRRPLWELSHLPRKDKSPVRLGEDPPRRVDQPDSRGLDAHHPRRRRRRTGGPRDRERGPGPIRGLVARRGRGEIRRSSRETFVSAERLTELLDRHRHGIEDALQVVEELLEPIRRHRAFRRRLDQPLLLQDAKGIAHLVLWKIQQLGETDDADRLVLHDRLEHRDVPLQELDLGFDLARERAPPCHRKPPLHSVAWSMIAWPFLKRSAPLRDEPGHRPVARLSRSAACCGVSPAAMRSYTNFERTRFMISSPIPVTDTAPFGPAYRPAPTIGESPTRPGSMKDVPPVELPAAKRPLRSRATAPTVSRSSIRFHFRA